MYSFIFTNVVIKVNLLLEDEIVFLQQVFIFIITFQRINLLPLISTISLIREVMLLIFLTKNVGVYYFLFQSWLK